MPATLAIGFFVFGAVLVLIALIGGRFQIFSVIVSSATASFPVRFIAFILGAIFLSLATYMGLSEVFAKSIDVSTTNAPIVISEPPSTLSEPQPTQTNPPLISTDTPPPQKPSPIDFIISYWQNVSDGRFGNSWTQLSPRFRQAAHHNDFGDYVRGYEQMNLCRIVVNNINLVQQDNSSTIATAHFVYYTGAQCTSSEYDFEMWLVFDEAANSWSFDKNIVR